MEVIWHQTIGANINKWILLRNKKLNVWILSELLGKSSDPLHIAGVKQGKKSMIVILILKNISFVYTSVVDVIILFWCRCDVSCHAISIHPSMSRLNLDMEG